MAVLNATRNAQYPLMAEFTFNWDDTMTAVSGTGNFVDVSAHVFDVINLPQGAVVVGGDIVTETTFTGATAVNVTVGDSGSANRYLGTTDKLTAGRTALVPTGYVGTGENIRLTVTPTVAPVTAGKCTLRVLFTVRNKANETYPS